MPASSDTTQVEAQRLSTPLNSCCCDRQGIISLFVTEIEKDSWSCRVPVARTLKATGPGPGRPARASGCSRVGMFGFLTKIGTSDGRKVIGIPLMNAVTEPDGISHSHSRGSSHTSNPTSPPLKELKAPLHFPLNAMRRVFLQT